MRSGEALKNVTYFHRLISEGMFHFDRLNISGIDNKPVFKLNVPEMVEQETCLFHPDIANGDAYLDLLHSAVERSITEKRSLPIVRFADGEYAFYRYSLACNGLYQQAESVRAIRKAMPLHIEALQQLAQRGAVAPLIFPGNIRPEKRSVFSFFRRSKRSISAAEFLDFLLQNQILLSRENYIPFYVVYAYLTSEPFAKLMNGKRICIVSSEYNGDKCREWFERFSSRPILSFVEIPDSYIATRWDTMKAGVLNRIPEDTDICFVGAGVGALPVCVDVAERLSIPAIDAGHVLNMMNGREDKSKGPRLYTMWK
jgi:hypothetical protein